MEGFLLIDKPEGWTSFDVVNHVRAIIAHYLDCQPRSIKVGHTGTLDPAATGLLVLCIGRKYTKKAQQMLKHNKKYIAEIRFGATSSTGDKEGLITNDDRQKNITKSGLLSVLENFIGVIDQRPPDYSAVKVNGKRAYQLARKGMKVDIKTRKVIIQSLIVEKFKWPNVIISCDVGSGTYIRSLVIDIGKSLGVGAYLSGLRRVSVDKWSITDAVSAKNITIEVIINNLFD